MTLAQLTDRLNQHACDPLGLARWLWPHVRFYDRQIEIIESVRDNNETWVIAGNQLGKDFVAGFLCLWAFLCHPVVRVVTTTTRADHLRVLWGEIGRFVRTAAVPLEMDRGGVLRCNHWDYRKLDATGQLCPVSYLRGMTCERPEGLAGHHAPFGLAVVDEASGVDATVFEQFRTWAGRLLAIGNPNPCGVDHPFYQAAQQGDI